LTEEDDPPQDPITLSAYITAQAVSEHFSSPNDRKISIRRLKDIGITKAYVEFYRGGLALPHGILSETRDSLEGEGITAAGGIATTYGEGFTAQSTGGSHWVCFSSEVTRSNLADAMRTGARAFDTIIIDDFMCTDCECDLCIEGKGDRDWSEFRRDLLVRFASECLIGPAKDENPKVQLIIKYPQWYDRFHVYGYDVKRESEIFDLVWVGTEIRDPRVDYVHQYQAFSNYAYISSLAGQKVAGAWFDHLWCYPDIYLEQAYQSVLAGAPELVLFSYSPAKYDSLNPNTSALIEQKDRLDHLRSAIAGTKHMGIEAYKPANSDPGRETYLFDYLGMLGLPVLVTASRPRTSSIILSEHSLADADIESYALNPPAGTCIMATPGFLDGVAPEVLECFGLSDEPVGRKSFFTYRFDVRGRTELAEENVIFNSFLRPESAEVAAKALSDRSYPILTLNRHDDSKYIATSLQTFGHEPYHGSPSVTTAEPVSLVHLPEAFVNAMRAEIMAPLGITLKAPAKIGLYLYSFPGSDKPCAAVVENFNDQDASIMLETGLPLQPELKGSRSLRNGRKLEIELPGRELELLSVYEIP